MAGRFVLGDLFCCSSQRFVGSSDLQVAQAMDTDRIAGLLALRDELCDVACDVSLLGEDAHRDLACAWVAGTSDLVLFLRFLGCAFVQPVLDRFWVSNGVNSMVVLVSSNPSTQASLCHAWGI
jgi:hypothetical protein